MANKTFSNWLASLAQATVAPGDLIPVVQGGVSKRAAAGQAGGLATLDANGMPLDASGTPIVAYGSNANGEYVRFADGTQICWGMVDLGNFTADGSKQAATITLPAAFVNPPKPAGSVIEGTNINGAAFYEQGGMDAPDGTTVRVAWRSSYGGASINATCRYVAIGRWK